MSDQGTVLAAPRAVAPSNKRAPTPGRGARRRVRLSVVLLGVLIVLVGAVAGVQVAVRVDDRVPVLAVARPVAAGQVIGEADLTTALVTVDAQVRTMPAAALSTVVGATAATPLTVGSLLSPAQVGAPVWPARGEAVTAVAVKPGRAPAGLSAGMRVSVLVVPQNPPGTAAGAAGGTRVEQAAATVVSVEPAADQSGVLVVTVLLTADAATRIASAVGEASLVQLGAGG